MHRKPLTKRLLAALLAGALAAGCGTTVRNPVTGQTERTVMDEADELREGGKAHTEILKEYGALDNAALQAYVNGVGQKLAAQSHRANLKWTFTVLDSPEVNAFALPGGYVYITRGIMAYLDSEADLAGVLGHEIGHVTARHGAQQATRQQSAGLAVIGVTVLGAILGGSSGAQAAGELGQQVAAGHVAKYSREHELQADQLGAEYLARVRYDPKHMVDVIQVLKDQERFSADAAKAAGRAVPEGAGWLASHPTSDQRLADIAASAKRLAGARGDAAWDDDGRGRYLSAIDGVTFGDSRAQGVVRGRHFFHEPLGIALTAPQGWRIVNDSEQVALVSGARDAALLMQVVPAKAGSDHEAILRNTLGATAGRVERLTLGGSLPATHFSGTRRDRQGAIKPIEVTLVTGPENRVFALGWVGRDAAALQRVRPALREAELSFRALSAADLQAARPWRVKLVPFPDGGFAALARTTPLTELAEQQLRLLNGAYGHGTELRPGQLVKSIE